MNSKHETETSKPDSDALMHLLTSEESRQLDIDRYFVDALQQMKEEVSVMDPKKARAGLVLLARNLVLATSTINGGSRAVDKMSDVYKEVFNFGQQFAGVNLDATAAEGVELSIHDKLENLQVALEADDRFEIPEFVSPEATIGLTEALAYANKNLLSTEDTIGMTNQTDLRYYVDNFVAASKLLAKGDM